MSNVNALLQGRTIKLADGVCLEKAYEKELAFEEYLRAAIALTPKIKTHRRRLRKLVADVNALEQQMQSLGDKELAAGLKSACLEMRYQGFQDRFLVKAFAIIREASQRTLGMRHHDVQLIGGWAMLQGKIAEMETGEGKTLVATLAACTAAASGATVHVITVNDYLAERDAESNKPLYEFFGLNVGVIIQDVPLEKRYEQYARNIVYVSNKEIVFDYLKDRIALGNTLSSHQNLRSLYKGSQKSKVLLNGLHVAIVDEADSILIDEARTPLIISDTIPDETGGELYHRSLKLAKNLVVDEHFGITEHREVWLTNKGENYLGELTREAEGVWTSSLWRNELVQKALTALWCYDRDQHYIVQDDKVQIVDEFSGRVMPDRSWENGLHQMVEAKENCEVTGQRKTLSKMTYQRFLGRYLLLCGMTGTASEVKLELKRVYDIEVFRIPTRLPVVRKRIRDSCWRTAGERWRAVSERASELSRNGQAVLIGTRSVEASESLSELLTNMGLDHTMLNARNDSEEAEIVARAGQGGNITIATNMAGRGTDIKPSETVLDKGGLYVILTEFHESGRVDRQLFGRTARQGQPGLTEAMVSLEDGLFVRFAPLLTAMMKMACSQNGKLPHWMLKLLVGYSQVLAEKHNARIRIATLKQDKKLHSLLAFSGAQ